MFKCILIALGLFFVSDVTGQSVQLGYPYPPQLAVNGDGKFLVVDIHLSSAYPFTPLSLNGTTSYFNRTIKKFQLKSSDSTRYVAYFWVKMDSLTDIQTLAISLDYSDNLRKSKRVEIEVPLNLKEPLTVSSTVDRGMWLAANAPDENSEHTNHTVLFPKNYRVIDSSNLIFGHNNQRFAIDLVSMKRNGRLYHSNGLQNKDWYTYGKKVRAIKKGIVIAALDTVTDQPKPGKILLPINLKTVAGNYLFIEHPDGTISFYGHLQQGSLNVKIGDLVEEGDVIGQIGNSGQSTAPHLHFHLLMKMGLEFQDSYQGFFYESVAYKFETLYSFGLFPEENWIENEDETFWVKPYTLGEIKIGHNRLPNNFEVIRFR